MLLAFATCKQTQPTDNQTTNEPSAKELYQEILSLEKDILKDLDVNKNKAKAEELLLKSKLFYKKYPEEKEIPNVLFKAADVSRGLGEYGKAIQLWGTVWRNYPSYERAADALFLQGFTFENDLGDKEQAYSYYNQFLEKYPKHELAEQVRLSIQQLNRSPEDLIKSFEKN